MVLLNLEVSSKPLFPRRVEQKLDFSPSLLLQDDAVPTSDFQLEVLRSGKRALRLGWVVACLQARERVCDESWLVRLPTKETVEPVL